MFFRRPSKQETNQNLDHTGDVKQSPTECFFHNPFYDVNAFKQQVLVGVVIGTAQLAITMKAQQIAIRPAVLIPAEPFFPPSCPSLRACFRASHLCVSGPILEEVFFRGLIMPTIKNGLENLGLQERHAKSMSLIGSSLLFAAAHGRGHLASPFIGGLVYGALTQYYDNKLVPGTVAHMTNNTIGVYSLIRKR